MFSVSSVEQEICPNQICDFDQFPRRGEDRRARLSELSCCNANTRLVFATITSCFRLCHCWPQRSEARAKLL
jgi:hypothetical protein